MAIAGRARTRSTRSSSAAGRRPGSTPASSSGCWRWSAAGSRSRPGGEWTVEANPGTLDEEKADVLADGRREPGQPRGAVVPARACSGPWSGTTPPRRSRRALDLVRPRFPRWSFDLIFGVPGSTPDLWADDLETALGLGPSHLSCYGLVYEKGTALWKQWKAGPGPRRSTRRPSGRCTRTRSTGSAAEGLAMYEISNFARPGHESRHNLVYWANDAYFGVGLGAARYVGGVRSVNTRDLPAYLRRIEAGEPATGPTETLDPEARARETAVLMLRRTGVGLDRDDFAPPDRLRPRRPRRPRPRPVRRRRAARRRRPPRPVHPRGAVPGRHACSATCSERRRCDNRGSRPASIRSRLPELVGAGGELDDGGLEEAAGVAAGARGRPRRSPRPGSRRSLP